MPRTEDAEGDETPGMLYESRTASKGLVVWYSLIDTAERQTVVFTLPEEYATPETYARLEELAGWLVDENAHAKRQSFSLVTRE